MMHTHEPHSTDCKELADAWGILCAPGHVAPDALKTACETVINLAKDQRADSARDILMISQVKIKGRTE